MSWPGAPYDEGSFDIIRNGEVVGREQFSIRQAATRGARSAITVVTRAQYPPDAAGSSLSLAVEFQPDSQVSLAQYELAGGTERVLVRFTPGRITVRIGRPGRESTREYPGGPRPVLVDDSLFASLAVPPGTRPGLVTLFSPRDGRRTPASLVVAGREATTVGREERILKRLTLRTAAESRHLWFDERGRLIKVEVPALGIRVLRSPPPTP
ncbi:MAG: hypothetical protein ACE5PT_06415 [Gemmatimonadales bacterium]